MAPSAFGNGAGRVSAAAKVLSPAALEIDAADQSQDIIRRQLVDDRGDFAARRLADELVDDARRGGAGEVQRGDARAKALGLRPGEGGVEMGPLIDPQTIGDGDGGGGGRHEASADIAERLAGGGKREALRAELQSGREIVGSRPARALSEHHQRRHHAQWRDQDGRGRSVALQAIEQRFAKGCRGGAQPDSRGGRLRRRHRRG